MKKLNVENPFFEFMGNLGDLILLNLIHLLFCIPVFTIGAATSALYQVMLRRVRGESNYTIREYIKAFLSEWKKSTKLWIPLLFAGCILIFDILYIGRGWNVWGIAIGCMLFIWWMLVCYVFPVECRFENTWKNTMKNAFYMAIRHFPYTILIMLLNAVPVICFLAGARVMALTAPIFLVVGFALIARANAMLFGRIFEHYGAQQEE